MAPGDYLQGTLNAAPRLAKGTAAEGRDICGRDEDASSAFGAEVGICEFGTGLLSAASSFIVALSI